MAIFQVCEGRPGQGKSLYTARLTKRILKRNKKWFKKTGIIRPIYSNLKFSSEFERSAGLFIDYENNPSSDPSNDLLLPQSHSVPRFLYYWVDSKHLVTLNDVDIIWDEIATELDSRNFADLSIEMKRFLSQYRKRGIDIYSNTQDFSMIDARARLMISDVFTLSKLIGSRDVSTTKPKPRFIWGLVLIRQVENFRETDPEKKLYSIVPSFMFIEKTLVSMYDTRQDIPLGKPAPLHHVDLYCEDPNCSYHRVKHN